MDKAKAREPKRTTPVPRRQQRSPSSVPPKKQLLEKVISVDECGKRGKGESRGRSLSNEERDAGSDGKHNLRPNEASVAEGGACRSKTPVKIMGDVETCLSRVDSAVVPRKQRSATGKRYRDPSSSALVVNGESNKNRMMMSKRALALKEYADSLSKEEEDVVMILAAFSTLAGDLQTSRDGTYEKRKCLPTLPEALESPGVKLQLLSSDIPCTHVEELKRANPRVKCNASFSPPKSCEPNDIREKNIQMPTLVTSSYHRKRRNELKTTCLEDASAYPSSPDNVKQSTETGRSILPKPEVGALPVEDIASTLNHVVKPLYFGRNDSPFSFQEDTILEVQNAQLTSSSELLTETFSHKNVDQAYLACLDMARSSSFNDMHSRKPLLHLADHRRWKNCASHINICQFIQSYQISENESDASSFNQLKLDTSLASTEPGKVRNGQISLAVGSTCSSAAKNQHEVKGDILQEIRLQSSVQEPHISYKFSERKQTHDFLSLAGGCESKSAGNAPGSFSTACPHIMPAPSSVVSLPVHHNHFSSCLEAAATPQKMQLPHFGNVFYASHGGNIHFQQQQQQQQQMLHARLTQYRASDPLAGKWLGSKHHNASSSPMSLAQLQPGIGGSHLGNLRGLSGRHPNWHQRKMDPSM